MVFPPTLNMTPVITLLTSTNWTEYELLDSGDGQKLERFGPYIFIRPEVQALWSKALPSEKWQAAHAVFQPSGEESGGHWSFRKKVPEQWEMNYLLPGVVGETKRGEEPAFFGDDHPRSAPGSLPGMCSALGLDGRSRSEERKAVTLQLAACECPQFIWLYRVGLTCLRRGRGQGHPRGCFEEIRELGPHQPGHFWVGGQAHPLDRGRRAEVR
jgi:hypothetical protein